MGCHEFWRNRKKLLKGSNDLWEPNQKIVYHKIWNPRASWFEGEMQKLIILNNSYIIYCNCFIFYFSHGCHLR